MNFFLKATEIWLPDGANTQLYLDSFHYGELTAFESVSRDLRFAYGEGLPGQTWSEGKPLIWTDLDSDAFQRSGAAKDSGLICGVSIPVMAGDYLLAVIVLFFGEGKGMAGAVEIWNNQAGSDSEMKLLDGYYGDLDRFEWISKRLTMMYGRGLPGTAWKMQKPIIMSDLATSNSFMRARNAAEAGITTGLAIPFFKGSEQVSVLDLLSAKGTPIARRFEIWTPNKEGKLAFEAGYSHEDSDLQALYLDTQFARGEGLLGQVWLTGCPIIAPASASYAEGVPAHPMVILPVIMQGHLSAVVILAL